MLERQRPLLVLLFGIAALGLLPASRSEPVTDEERCAVDRSRVLTMDQQSFDQGPTGWREIARPGCYTIAADLIRDWRNLNAPNSTILFWHEGQMRANANDYRQAIVLFARARKQPGEEMAKAWNIYVDGSIAFLSADRQALERARAMLARTKKPRDFAPSDSADKPIAVPWPPNLGVLDSLRRCWGQSYRTAYSCRLPN